MDLLARLLIFWSIAVYLNVHGELTPTNNNPSYVTNLMKITSTTADNVTTSPSATARYVLVPKRKAMLILQTDDDVLRTNKKKGKHKQNNNQKSAIKCLKYVEYDDSGNLLNTVHMYNLNDVADFFRAFLDTRICVNSCDELV